ncbi:cell surface protein [Lactobacillus curvatus]|nr:cell surface protein [Latilactobacillus curvatus]MSE24210.1 cell surface protein [Latilactobacillus curvatus]
MKFTKLTSAALVGASVLSVFAVPTTSFAATHEGSAVDNGGTPLPQNDTTTAGISFGDNKPNANTGFLRLQMVPHVLDFGNHAKFDSAYATFTADGQNYANKSNNQHAAYDNTDASKTAILNSDDTKLAGVVGDAWTTVVDKQVTRDQLKTYDANTTQAAGDWQLNVKADDGLKSVSGQELKDATLLFKNTAYARTTDVVGLTNETQDSSFATDFGATAAADKGDKDLTDITKSFALDMSSNDTNHQVATAATNEGTGANVFGWNPEDIQLVLPSNTAVNNAIYTANLTWTLSTGK